MVAMVSWIIYEIWSASLLWGEIAVPIITAPDYRKADQYNGTVDKRWLFGSSMWSWAFLHLQEWGKLFSHYYFLMWIMCIVFIECVTILLSISFFDSFDHKTCVNLSPWLRMEPVPPALEDKVLTTNALEKSYHLTHYSLLIFDSIFFPNVQTSPLRYEDFVWLLALHERILSTPVWAPLGLL